jgi:hypothetical protein
MNDNRYHAAQDWAHGLAKHEVDAEDRIWLAKLLLLSYNRGCKDSKKTLTEDISTWCFRQHKDRMARVPEAERVNFDAVFGAEDPGAAQKFKARFPVVRARVNVAASGLPLKQRIELLKSMLEEYEAAAEVQPKEGT